MCLQIVHLDQHWYTTMKIRHMLPLLGALFAPTAMAGLVDGGFEDPPFADNSVNFPDAAAVPGWETSATDNVIEVWVTAFSGVSAYEGRQFAELNANQVSTLYQEVSGIAAGSIVGYQFAHRGRAGVDQMRFTLVDYGSDGVLGGTDDTTLFSILVSDDNTAWGFYSGSGITALGNTVRFSFESVSAAGGPTVGNFLDAADFGIGIGTVPEPGTVALLGLGLAGFGFLRRKQ